MRRSIGGVILLAGLLLGRAGSPAQAGPFGGPEHGQGHGHGHGHSRECPHEHHVFMPERGDCDRHSRLRDRLQHMFPKDEAAEAAYYARHTHCRAGSPRCVGTHNQPSERPSECGYYVGGGAAFHGDVRCRNEGTFGWDYCHGLLPHRAILGWYHGRRYQGGIGSYEPNGPHVPDIFATDYHGAAHRHFGGGEE